MAITTPQGLDFQVEGELKLDQKTTPSKPELVQLRRPRRAAAPRNRRRLQGRRRYLHCLQRRIPRRTAQGIQARRKCPGRPGGLPPRRRKETDSPVHAQEGSVPLSPSVSDSNRAGTMSEVRQSVPATNDRGQAAETTRSTAVVVAPVPMTTVNQTQYPANRRVKRRPIRSTISALLGNRPTATDRGVPDQLSGMTRHPERSGPQGFPACGDRDAGAIGAEATGKKLALIQSKRPRRSDAQDQAAGDQFLLDGQKRLVGDGGQLGRERGLVAHPGIPGSVDPSQGPPGRVGGWAPWKKSHEIARPIQMMKPKRLTA